MHRLVSLPSPLRRHAPWLAFAALACYIVVAIIAIPIYFNYTAYAEGTEALSLASSVTTDIARFYSENDHYPTNNQSAGAPSPTSIAGKYVQSVTIAGGLIKAKFKV